MAGDNMREPTRHGQGDRRREESHRSILARIEEKLSRLLGGEGGDRREDQGFAPGALTWEEGDVEPRILGGPHASAPGWDPGFAGPRFDRVDVGSVGTHGVHPVSSVDGYFYGIGAGGGYRSSAREHYMRQQQARRQQSDDQQRRYENWRGQQVQALDRDYGEYCREQQAKFDREFGDWRTKRQRQREALSRVSENMDVVGSDGERVGIVEAVGDGGIALAGDERDGGATRRVVPYTWIEAVDVKVILDRPADQARAEPKPAETATAA